jgi:hypothetical protein
LLIFSPFTPSQCVFLLVLEPTVVLGSKIFPLASLSTYTWSFPHLQITYTFLSLEIYLKTTYSVKPSISHLFKKCNLQKLFPFLAFFPFYNMYVSLM